MTATKLPDPLVPAEVDLRDFPGMWVDTDRLLRSDTWILGTSDEKAAAFTLWAESWHQVPAASLPGNDRVLAKLSQAERWPKAKGHALRGWIECNDGRLYHPVVAEKALEAWIEKLAAAISGAAGNAKRWQVEVDTAPQRAQFKTAVETLKIINPASRTLKKKVVAVILAASRPESGGDIPPQSGGDSGGDASEPSGGDRKGPDRTGPDQTLNKQENHPPPAQRAGAGEGSPYGSICRSLKQAGIGRVNPGELRFRALVDAGATAEEFLAYVDRALDKGEPFAWLIGTVEGERKRAAATAGQLHRGPMPKADDRKSRQLETAALMTGATRVRQAPATEPETIDVASRILPA